MPTVFKDIVVSNENGFHARPAMSFVDVANRFQSRITLSKLGDDPCDADGKSIMSLLTLAATQGTSLRIKADGEDAQGALEALCELFEGHFGEK
jgi:phosphotransferase system HPr (HPr) family protein